MQRFRGELVFKANRRLYHSTLGRLEGNKEEKEAEGDLVDLDVVLLGLVGRLGVAEQVADLLVVDLEARARQLHLCFWDVRVSIVSIVSIVSVVCARHALWGQLSVSVAEEVADLLVVDLEARARQLHLYVCQHCQHVLSALSAFSALCVSGTLKGVGSVSPTRFMGSTKCVCRGANRGSPRCRSRDSSTSSCQHRVL